MDSIQDLVDLLKEGRLSREQVLERVASASIKSPSRPPSSLTNHSRGNIETPGWEAQESTVNCSDDDLPRSPPVQTPQGSKSSKKHSFDEFFQRLNRYECYKADNKAKRKEMHEYLSVKDCTFEPQLYVETSPGGNTMKRLTQSKDYSAYEAMKSEREKAKEESELRECTFQPRINTKNQFPKPLYSSRNLSATRLKAEKHFQQVCTFQPKVLGVKRKMSNASLYTKESPFERLYNKSDFQTPAHSTAPDSEMYSEVDSMSVAEREQNLNEFFMRQHRFLEDKHKKLQARLKEPEHQPKLCEKSTKLAKGTFEERNEELLKKRREFANTEVENKFTPKISALGKASRHRSIEELCYGDMERKQRKLEELKKMYEDESTRNFQMTYVQYPSAIEASSKLQILDHSDSYLERIREARERRAQREEHDRQEKEARELAECTYAPSIREAPAFVKRVAHSMALLRAQRGLDEPEELEKPDWR
mmetsp:Transcript_28526/g.50663  ORF Transcript_28526/g.50663 Transcript_28526/m.50663 type:complete len:478 (+) Transcript_28526:201-1634(+)